MTPKSSRKPPARSKTEGAPEKPLSFEEALTELEQIVEELEDGSLSLERALSRFERGIQLSKQLQKQLSGAEARVRKLIGQEGDEVLLEDREGDIEGEQPEEGAEEDDGSPEETDNPTLPF